MFWKNPGFDDKQHSSARSLIWRVEVLLNDRSEKVGPHFSKPPITRSEALLMFIFIPMTPSWYKRIADWTKNNINSVTTIIPKPLKSNKPQLLLVIMVKRQGLRGGKLFNNLTSFHDFQENIVTSLIKHQTISLFSIWLGVKDYKISRHNTIGSRLFTST